MPLATLLTLDFQVLMCCPKPLPLVITASSAKVGSSQGNTWGVTATTFGKASTFVMPPKKTSALGATLQPLDTNQETISLREARSQKRKATSPTLQEEELDQEIRDLEVIHQQVQRKREKMARLADLQKKIDEADEEMRHLTQEDYDRRPQHRELRQESSFNE
jgi:hypothetical protein